MKKRFEIFMICCLLVSAFYLARKTAFLTHSDASSDDAYYVVIDAGHGDNDSGKVGVNGALEKDINLAISLKLKDLLEEQTIGTHPVKVILTRGSDKILSDDNASNIKNSDMKNRAALIEKISPDLVISIHQNSFSDPNVSGPQVFYYSKSDDGMQIAQLLQNSLNEFLEPTSPRNAKANSDYYLLKKTPTPTVIVECGFLSNPSEADMLVSDTYQNKIAASLSSAIQEYLEGL